MDTTDNPLPAGVRVIAALFALCGLYLAIAGLVMLIHPGQISMTVGAPLLFGLELAGPYMFLLTGAVAGTIAGGMLRRINLARFAAVLAAVAGIVMLVPSVSAAVVMVQVRPLAIDGFAIVIRVVVAWYLWQGHVVEEFKKAR
jgi:hypothetical protein